MFNIKDLEEIIKDLYINYPLFGYVLIEVERSENKSIPTAQVIKRNEKIHLEFNPDFMSSLAYEEQKGIVVHEISHLIMDHFSRFKEETELKNPIIHHAVNIAADCAINQIIVKHGFSLPEKTVTKQTVEKMANKKLKDFETSEYYYDALIQSNSFKENLSDYQDLLDAIDNHNFDNIPEKYKEIIKKATSKQKKQDIQRGTLAGDSILEITVEKEKVIDKNLWKKLINKNFYCELSPNTYYKYNHPSRRNPNSIYGKKRKIENKNVWVVIDTSGSTTNYIPGFINQINAAMRQSDISVNLIQCDSEIQKIDMNLRRIKNNFQIKGLGGTTLTKAMDYIDENDKSKNKRVVILTDGYTDWKDYSHMYITALYTYNHSELQDIKFSAVMRM